jgi:hypothetical protein
VLNDRFIGEWAQLSGDVEVVSLPQAMEPLVEYYRSHLRGASGLGRLPGGHDQTGPLPDPDYADQSRSDRLRLTTLATGGKSRPASPRDGADRFIPTGTDAVLALGHYLGRGYEAAFAHVIHATLSCPDPVPPATG